MANIKYIKRIDANNKKREYIDGDEIEFTLPKNKQDLTSFKMFFEAEIDPVIKYSNGSFLKRFMPRLSSSIIETLTIYKDGKEIQTIKDYNILFNIIHDASKEFDEIDSDRIDTLNYSYIDNNNNAKTVCDFNNNTDSAVINPIKYKFFINSFLGFLNENNRSIIDTSNSTIKISIKLAPKYICYRGINNIIQPPSAELFGGNPTTDAVITPIVNNNGEITSFTIDNGGVGYTEEPDIIILGSGSGFNGTVVLTGGVITDIVVINGGSFYYPPLTIDTTYPTDFNYKISNVYANIDIYPQDTPVLQSITFKHYHTVKGSINDTQESHLSYNHKGQLNYILSSFVNFGTQDEGLQLNKCNIDTTRFGDFFRDKYGNSDFLGKNLLTSFTINSELVKSLYSENNLDNSIYFKRSGSNVKASHFVINGQNMTPEMDTIQIYNVAKEFFNGDMNRVKSLSSFSNEFFVFPILMNQMDKDFVSEIQWNCSSMNKTEFQSYPIMFLCFDKEISI